MLSVSKWRRILRWKTETKSAPKTIFSGNGNGLKNFTFLSTREQKNVHRVYVKKTTCVHCVWNQMRSKLGACDWPAFKINRPQINNSCMWNFHWDYDGKTHKLSITEGSIRLLFELERTRSQCTPVSTTRLLVSLYSVFVWTLCGPMYFGP